MLSLLSAAVTNGQPLPPYLTPPSSYKLSEKMEKVDPGILSVRHITEPAYSAFAVTQVASTLIGHDLEQLIAEVKSLVGEMDFSFHVITTDEGGSSESVLGKKEAENAKSRKAD